MDHVRLFPNLPELRWRYRVHEQILGSLRKLGGTVRWADVTIHHTGYQDAAVRARKLERDLRLLTLEDRENPDDPFTLFNLGSVFLEQKKIAEGLAMLERSLARSHPSDSIVRKLYAQIAQCRRLLGRLPDALAACTEGRGYYPDDPELLFQESLARQAQGDRAGAKACLLKVLEARQDNHFASRDTGLSGYKARHNLAVLYREEGNLAEAERQWRLALAEAPGFGPAQQGLREIGRDAETRLRHK